MNIYEMSEQASRSNNYWLEHFAALVAAAARADERTSFYGQDKPAQCAKGCPPRQICEYCQIVEPVKQMIADEREACAYIAENWNSNGSPRVGVANAIRARGTT